MRRFAVAGGLMAAALAGVVLADEKALKELEGTYAVTAMEKAGEVAPKDKRDALRVVIAGDELTIKTAEGDRKAKIKVTPSADPAKAPSTIDLAPTDGDHKGKTFPGIYKAEKGEVTLVFTEKGDRPKEFKPEGSAVLMRLKKDDGKKGEPKKDEPKKDEME